MVTNEKQLKEGCEILIQAAAPDIYRINAFRISGLNINATTREIAIQIQKNQMLEKYGGKLKNNKSPFPIVPLPDNDQLRQALHRLRDPEMRIIDEFFWFWPHSLDSANKDHALDALSKNDIKTAVSLWINYEATLTESNVSRHNLAVLSHLQVLDIEINGQSLTDEEISKRDKYWEDTFKRWKLLLEHEGFWSRLTARVRQMDDPRLTTGFVKRLRESLPFAILQINAILALKAAEAGDKSEAARQLGIMNNSGFGEEVVDTILKKVANPLRSRIKIMCKSYSHETYSDKKKEIITCKSLLEQAMPILNILHTLFPKDNLIKEGAYDEVALTVALLAIEYANANEDSESVVPIFEELRRIVIGEFAANKIERNYKIFKKNVEFDQLYNTCFFCKKNKSDKKSEIKISMHGDIRKVEVFNLGGVEYEMPYDGGYTYNPIYTKWNYSTFIIPRCLNCKKQHNKLSKGAVGLFLGFLLGIILASIIQEKAGLISLLISSLLGFIVGISYKKDKTIKKYSYYKEFPTIKEKLKMGWTWGERPVQN
ncbi:MAG: hypothetical protein ACQETL_18550 [Bacteroidota bacterium]